MNRFRQARWTTTFSIAAIMIARMSVSSFSAGTEGASFLDIPVGADPAAMGSAYSALANNAYAPTWNPGGLGFLHGNELAAQHLSYLESINYEYLSYVHPFGTVDASGTSARGLGISAQYLGSGDITRTSAVDGSPQGDFSSHYGSYDLSYGQKVTDKLSLGLTGKWINAQIDDVSANAYGVDFGSLYQLSQKLNLAATLDNVGSKLKFLTDGDSLPLQFHLGGSFQPNVHWLLSMEGVYEKAGPSSFHVGGSWQPMEMLSLRVGYHTDTLDGLSALAGLTAGLGIHLWGQEFAYAWAPYGDLGNAQYFSLLIRFGAREEEKRNLIQYQTIKEHRTVQKGDDANEPEYQQLMQLLSTDDEHVAQKDSSSPANDR